MKASDTSCIRKGDCLNYTDLLTEATSEGLTVKEKQLQAYDGRIKGNLIVLRSGMPTAKKSCVLAEELGHRYTTYGDILGQCSVDDQKQEQRARLWAYNKMIGLQGIVSAYRNGCSSLHDMAEFLEVTEEFLSEALNRYRGKYGCYATVDNYIIYFEPHLAVMELYI